MLELLLDPLALVLIAGLFVTATFSVTLGAAAGALIYARNRSAGLRAGSWGSAGVCLLLFATAAIFV